MARKIYGWDSDLPVQETWECLKQWDRQEREDGQRERREMSFYALKFIGLQAALFSASYVVTGLFGS